MMKLTLLTFILLFLFSCVGGGDAGFTPNKLITVEMDEEFGRDFEILSITTSSGVFAESESVNIRVTFSKRVKIISGTPRLEINVGGTQRYATYVSGTNSDSLIFSYTVQNGDSDSNGLGATSPFDLNGSVIEDYYSNPLLDLTFATTTTSTAIIDTVAPSVSFVTPPVNGTYVISSNLDFYLQFNENVYVANFPRLALMIGATTVYAQYVSGSGGDTLLFRYTTQPADTDNNGIAMASPIDLDGGDIEDVAGNNASLAYLPPVTSGVLVSNDSPYSLSMNINANATATKLTATTLTIAATNATQMYVTNTAGCASGGSWVAYATSKAWTLTGGNGVKDVYIKFRTASLNESACISDSIIYDTLAPNAVTSINVTNNATTTTSATTSFTCTDNGLAGCYSYEIAISWSTSTGDIIPGGGWTSIGTTPSGRITSGITLNGANSFYTLIRATDAAGNVGPVAASSLWNFTDVPTTIANIEVTNRTKDSITIGWVLPDANAPAGITDYQIQTKPTSGGSWYTEVDGVSDLREFTLVSLNPVTSYDFRVRSYNGTFWSAWSNSFSFETLPDIAIFNNPYKAINIGGARYNRVVSLCDNNRIFVNGVQLPGSPINKHGLLTFTVPAGDFTELEADCEFFVAGRLGETAGAGTRGNLVWATNSWVGKEFYFNHNRSNPMVLRVYAFEDSQITIYRDGVIYNNGDVASLPSGSVVNISADSSQTFLIHHYDNFIVQSTGYVVAYAYARGAGGNEVVDPKPLLPTSTSILGIPSRNGKVSIGQNSTIDWISSGGTQVTGLSALSSNVTNIAGIVYNVGVYQEQSVIISSTSRLAANSYADANGSCSAPFVPLTMLKKKFAINVTAEYVAFASDVDVTVNWTKPPGATAPLTGTILIERLAGNNNPNSPRKAYSGTDFPAGTIFEGDAQFQMWYEPKDDNWGANDDETIMFGWN